MILQNYKLIRGKIYILNGKDYNIFENNAFKKAKKIYSFGDALNLKNNFHTHILNNNNPSKDEIFSIQLRNPEIVILNNCDFNVKSIEYLSMTGHMVILYNCNLKKINSFNPENNFFIVNLNKLITKNKLNNF